MDKRFKTMYRKITKEKNERLTSGFTQAGVYARPKFFINFAASVLVRTFAFPRLRKAAPTLAATRRQRSGKSTYIQK